MNKNNILILLIALLAFSCQKESKIEFYDLGSEIYLSSDGMTSLDNQVVVTVENPLKNLTSVTAAVISATDAAVGDAKPTPSTPTNTDLGELTFSDGVATGTFTEAQLGISEEGSKSNLMVYAVYEGKNFKRPISITVKNPITIDAPTLIHKDSVVKMYVDVEPVSAVISDNTVIVETKKFKASSYAEVGKFNASDSLEFNGIDYEVGDSVYVKVTATAGTKTASEVAIIVVEPYNVYKTVSFVLDSTQNVGFDFMKARMLKTSAGDSVDIELTSNLVVGGYELGFESNNNAEFKEASALEYANSDSVIVVNKDFSGAFTSVANVMGGETYMFRTRRGANSYSYGYLKVVSITKPEGVLDESYVKFELKY